MAASCEAFDCLKSLSSAQLKEGLVAVGLLPSTDEDLSSAANEGLRLITEVAASALKGQAPGFSDYKPNWLERLVMWLFYPSKNPAVLRDLDAKPKDPPVLSFEVGKDIKRVFGESKQIPVEIEGQQTRYLSAMHYEASTESKKNATVVLFHGNAMVGSDMAGVARYYMSQGYDVLLPTMGGYPGSDTSIMTSEATTYQDVEAIKLYLQKEGVTKAGYHGVSIGGSLAFQAAAGETSAKLETAFVVADKTFTTGADVAVNRVRNLLPGPLSLLGACATRLAMKASGFPKGKDVKLPGGKMVQTDGLDNKAKASKLAKNNVPLLVLQGGKDDFMGMDRKGDTFENNFGDELWLAYTGGKEPTRDGLVTVPGWDHSAAVNIDAPKSEAIIGLNNLVKSLEASSS